MEEEVDTDPILTKLNGHKKPVVKQAEVTVVESKPEVVNSTTDEDPILKKLNAGLKKKDNAEQSQKPLSSVFTEQFKQPVPPSQKSTPKEQPKRTEKIGFFNQLGEIWDTLVKEYDDPVVQQKQDDPLVAAAKRGWATGDQAELVNPFQGTPDEGGIKKIAEIQQRIKSIAPSKEYTEFSNAGTFGDALSKLSKNPTKIIGELTAESLASIANYGATRIAGGAGVGAAAGSVVPGIGTAAGAGSGVIAGLADTSLALEYSNKFMETLAEQGVDLTNPESLEKAFADNELISRARESAYKKSIPIGIFDLISGGLAGKILNKPATSIAGKVLKGAGEVAIQGTLGGGGELVGQLVAGEKINPGAIVAEVVGELGTTPIEVAANTAGGVKTLVDKAKTPNQVVNDETIGADTKDSPAIEQSAENIQAKIDQDEAAIEKGETSRAIPVAKEKTDGTGTAVTEDTKTETLPEETEVQTKPIENEPVTESTEQLRSDTANPVAEETVTTDDQGGVIRQPEKQVSGIKKELAPEELVESTPVDKRTDKQVFEQGKADVDSGKINPQSIIDQVNKEPRALQANEVAALVYHKGRLDNQVNEATTRMQQAKESGDAQAEAKAQSDLESLNSQLNNYYEMSVKTANQQSMAFRLRKMLIDSEYNLQSQVAKYKAANKGQEIPADVMKRFEKLDSELKEANRKIDELQAKQANFSDNELLRKLRDSEKRNRMKALTDDRKKKINSFFDSLKADTSSKGMLSASVIPGITLLPHVWNGSLDVIKKAVLAGADVAEAIQAGVDYIKSQKAENFDEKAFADGMNPLVSKIVPKFKQPESAKAKRNKEGRLVIPADMVKEFVNEGITDIETLTENVKTLIKDEFPDATTREVRDAITKYGKTVVMSQEEVDVQLRQMKRIGKLISQLEDVQKGKRPERSGLQRDKPSDQERSMLKELNEAMKDLPVDEVAEENAYKSALDKVKSRLNNQIADLEAQIDTGKKTPKKKGIQYDQEAKDLQTKRDELKKMLEDIEGKQGIPDEKRLRDAVRATEKSIAEYDKKIKEGDFSKKEKKPLPDSQELSDLKAKRAALKDQYDKAKAELGIADKNRLELRKKSVQKGTEDLQRRIREKDFTKKKTTPVQPDKELTEALRERERIKYEFDVEQEKNRLDNRTFSEKVRDFGMDAVNLPKSLVSSIDLSAALRQGGFLLPSHPIAWSKAFVEMFRQAASEKRFNNWLLELKGSDLWPIIQNSKLFVADNNAKITAREEQFMSKLATQIPILGKTIKFGKSPYAKIPGLDLIGASSRAYAGFLNKLRTEVFAQGVDALQAQGKTPENSLEEYRSWADFVNNATGRGNLPGKTLEDSAPILNAAFFSPKFLASRFNLLNPVYYAKLSPYARKQALISALSFLGFGMAVMAIAGAAGADVEDDPRSTDFGKIKVGNTRYDIWGGFQPLVRLLAQLSTGEKKSTTTGKIIKLDGKKYGSDDRGDVALKFVRGKLAPVPAAAVNLLTGKNMVGEETTVADEAVRLSVPLYIQDMAEIFEQEGTGEALKTSIPAMFGIGVQNYGPRQKQKKAIDKPY